MDKIVSSNKVNLPIETKNIFKESKDHWQTTFDSVSDGIFVLDVNHKIERANKTLLQMIGKTKNEVCGRTCWEVIHGTNSPYCDCPVERMRESLKRESVIIQNGNNWLEINVDPILDNQGELIGIIHIVRDITEKKKIEEKIFQIKQNWEDTFNSITDMVTIHDKDYNIIHANKSAKKILKLPFFKNNNNRKCFKHYHGTNKPPEGCLSCDCLATESPTTFEVFEPHLNMFIEIRAIPRFNSEGKLAGLIHIVRDISERKDFEEKLKNLNIQLREFASNLQTIREDERASIARDIHDEMGQNLTALKLELSLIESELKAKKNLIDKQFLLNEVIDMQNITNNTIQKVRELIRKLRPEVLDHLGLIDALKWQVEEFEKRTRIKCLFNSNRKKLKVNEEVAIVIFRIVQESLTNILKHAKANEAKINIRKLNKYLEVKIIDNGIGFSSNVSSEKKSNGIIGMRERVSIIGGNFEIKTLDGKGTSVIISVPIE